MRLVVGIMVWLAPLGFTRGRGGRGEIHLFTKGTLLVSVPVHGFRRGDV